MSPHQSRERARAVLHAWFITFSCYGHRMHGDEHGSIDRDHNKFGTDVLPKNIHRELAERKQMSAKPYSLDKASQQIVLHALQEVCRHRGWILFAAHVRSTHVHMVVRAQERPERIMSDCKAYASRALRAAVDKSLQPWSRHGSTRYLWMRENLEDVIHYVVRQQGPAAAVFEAWDRSLTLAAL